MWSQARKLKDIGVLGINKRNADYTLKYNPRSLYRLVDDKLLTKQLAEKADIAVPKLYGVVEFQRQIKDVAVLLKPYPEFTVKPACGSGGDGIIVFTGISRTMYRKVNGMLMTIEGLKHHFSNILSGMYSLGGHPDKALIEYRVRFDPVFEGICFQGVPDIRIIVFLGVPVMSMVRLPTRFSHGKANLHQGAIGVGIDISTGKTLSGVWRNEIIDEHPDTGNPVTGLTIPGWKPLLYLASRCYELTGLGYQGVDIVMDEELGPMILEINARPGLNIQIANGTGLLHRLKLIEKSKIKSSPFEDRVDFAIRNFTA
ncbi:MAG: alpha-L-glutamate ligase-like protein [Thermodesulfobacteriota bacterium]|nr:alpha-L-glutamate ligase-like protein [Thermodesulfobacteriota bacterium]